MKKILLGICLLGILHKASTAQAVVNQQPAPDPASMVEKKIEIISRSHAAIFKLPHTKEYIRDVVVEEIKQNRYKVAPHYPERKPGVGITEVNSWISNYPDEVNNYVRYVGGIHRKYNTTKR